MEKTVKLIVVYITTRDRDEAMRIGRVLVEDRLAACVNVVDGMHSLYWWEGEVQQDSETVLIAKTREFYFSALVERVKGMHSYECPCVLSLPILDGNPGYLDWIQSETECCDE